MSIAGCHEWDLYTLDYVYLLDGAVVILWVPDMDGMPGGVRRLLAESEQTMRSCGQLGDNDTKMPSTTYS